MIRNRKLHIIKMKKKKQANKIPAALSETLNSDSNLPFESI